MTFDVAWVTLVITIVSAVALIALERISPYTEGQRIFRAGFVNDFVWYSLLQSYHSPRRERALALFCRHHLSFCSVSDTRRSATYYLDPILSLSVKSTEAKNGKVPGVFRQCTGTHLRI